MIDESLEAPRRGRGLRVLFGALVVFVLLVPLATRGPYGVAVLQLALAVLSVAAAWAIDAMRGRIAIGVVVAVLTLNLTTIVTGSRLHVALGLAALVAFLIWVISAIAVRLARETRVTADTLYGAVVVYMLIGIAFAIIYGIVELASPGAFGGLVRGPLQESLTVLRAGSEFPRLLYFSLVTLSTLGYGDVTPTHDFVRMLAPVEAILGQLYLAILIARLVALQLIPAVDEG